MKEVEYKTLRNKDFKEVTLEVHIIKQRCTVLLNLYFQMDGHPVLQFAAAYGFRNIQNLVQKLKRKKCQYHYVEVMACPSG